MSASASRLLSFAHLIPSKKKKHLYAISITLDSLRILAWEGQVCRIERKCRNIVLRCASFLGTEKQQFDI